MNAEQKEAATVPVIKAANAALNTEGFVTSLPSDMKPATFLVPRYTLARCADFGGVRGYGLDRRQARYNSSRSKSNPEGLFWEYVIKLTAPAPVILTTDASMPVRAEPNTIVVVLLEDHIEEIEPYFEDRDWSVELAFVPFKDAQNRLTMKAAVASKPVERKTLVAKK